MVAPVQETQTQTLPGFMLKYTSPALRSVPRPAKKIVPCVCSDIACKPATSPALDTLAHLDQNTSQAFARKNLEKRARNKFVTNIVLDGLLNLPSPLEKSYRQTTTCAAQLTEAEGKITGLYCNQRWCLVCSRIRTARLIKGYMPALDKMKDKTFLTLTIKNVSAKELRATVRKMLRVASLITRRLRRIRKVCGMVQFRPSFLRKIECTYNEVTNQYHPHFHFITDSVEAAEEFMAMWLEAWPSAKREAQDMRPADSNSCMELFKYFTKVVSKGKGGREDYRIHVAALDVMHQALRNVRTFQPSGVIKAVSEDVNELHSELTERDLLAAWAWNGWDWSCTIDSFAEVLDPDTGELWTKKSTCTMPLTGYLPSHGILDIKNHVVHGPSGRLGRLTPTPLSPSEQQIFTRKPK